MDEEVCWYFQDAKLLDVSTYSAEGGKVKEMTDVNINKQSLDRFGLLIRGRRALKKRLTPRKRQGAERRHLRGAPHQFRLDKN